MSLFTYPTKARNGRYLKQTKHIYIYLFIYQQLGNLFAKRNKNFENKMFLCYTKGALGSMITLKTYFICLTLFC